MTSYGTVQLDPPAAISNRTMLDLNSGAITVATIDWGQAEIDAVLAQEGVYGQGKVDFAIPNRTVTIGLGLGMDGGVGGVSQEDARDLLEMKVGMLNAEGGILMRQRTGGAPLYADIVTATLTLPDVWGATGDVEPDVNLVLTCKPDFYGDEVALDAMTATGIVNGVLQQDGAPAVIPGDWPARTRIKVTNGAAVGRDAIVWGLRSRHYDNASTAALVYDASDFTPLSGAATHALSGSASSTPIHLALPSPAIWSPMLQLTLSSDALLTHQGNYRVLARVYLQSGAGAWLRMRWGSPAGTAVTNAPSAISVLQAFFLVDLGVVRCQPSPVGDSGWVGVIDGNDAGGGDVYIDQVILVPLDEAAGQVLVPVTSQTLGATAGVTGIGGAGADATGNGGTFAWLSPNAVASSKTGTTITSASGLTHYLRVTNFGFSIPSTATIQGVRFEWVRQAGEPGVSDSSVFMLVGGVEAGSEMAQASQWSTSPQRVIYGNAGTLWGNALTPSIVNAANFGVSIAAETSYEASSVYVNYPVQCTVYYTLSSSPAAAQNNALFANGVGEIRTEGVWHAQASSTIYSRVPGATGDLPRLPPSRGEARPVEIIALTASAGTQYSAQGLQPSFSDTSLASTTVQVFYRPCYMGRI